MDIRGIRSSFACEDRRGMVTSGFLLMDRWGGRTETLIEIIGETPKRYRIKAITRTKVGGRYRWLEPGETRLVPKTAVKVKA